MTGSINWEALSIFVAFFALVTILGFVAARWKAGDLTLLNEWGLGGRRFGTLITWFLIGGDAYTAYTVIAVPALVYAVGAFGFFALPYTIIVYPFVFVVMPRLWTICHRESHVTVADFVQARFSSRWLALAVALTGLVATMPYIALQLVGIQVVIEALGFRGDMPLIVAFIILALYTYTSGLRAPAMIAFVKDAMIYIVVFAAVALIPVKLGGYGAVFAAAERAFAAKGGATGIILQPGQMLPFATLALGSALALFMYPHTVTGVLSASNAETVRKNAVLLPAYSFLLGLVALLGYMAIAAGVKVDHANQVVPALFLKIFPSWFVGFSFAAIAISALVPAAIMSIGASNLFTRNIWKTFINRRIAPNEEAAVAKVVSLVVKVGALFFIIGLQPEYAINLQLLGGIWILQIFPAVVFGLYQTRLPASSLLIGWASGIIVGTSLAASVGLKPIIRLAIAGNSYSLYIGLLALALNVVVTFALAAALNARAVNRAHQN
jgi:solute:Na+ symporter, SSS family